MPELADPKMETFAKLVSEGKSYTSAYRDSGLEGKDSKASPLAKDPAVVARVREINPNWVPRKPRGSTAVRAHSLVGKKGYIYAYTNPALPGLFKLGHTTRSVEQRLKEISNSSVPDDFVLYRAVEVDRSSAVEQMVFSRLAEHRYRSDREFFKVTEEQVDAVMNDLENGVFIDVGNVISEFMAEVKELFACPYAHMSTKNRIVTVSLGAHPTTDNDMLIEVPFGTKKRMMDVVRQGLRLRETTKKSAAYAA